MYKFGVLAVVCFGLIFSQSCKKSVSSNTGTSVYFPVGGLSNFDLENIIFGKDTTVVNFQVALYPSTIKENVTITAAVDDAKRLAYNAASTDLLYDALPDSCYSFSTPHVTINSGNLAASFSISFYTKRFDLTKSVMLPITITDAEGLAITDTLKTAYFHLNGNFLTADIYNVIGMRTEYSGTTASSDSIEGIDYFPATKIFFATGLNQAAVYYADLGSEGWEYLLNVDPVADTVGMQPNSIIFQQTGGSGFERTFTTDFKSYDNTTNTFHFITHYLNSDGKLRVVDETLVKQQ